MFQTETIVEPKKLRDVGRPNPVDFESNHDDLICIEKELVFGHRKTQAEIPATLHRASLAEMDTFASIGET